ncbi:hypothetical protein CDAR_95201 [Caerostris darwini]|uniref:Uncharacterized protein n=1 Tax=Caerostris darwini TaxID=1538125 RepID=A0AAV4PLL9_9ARAC|nr:hypothetical protein CDAR_95201 [Caerostris darwini]
MFHCDHRMDPPTTIPFEPNDLQKAGACNRSGSMSWRRSATGRRVAINPWENFGQTSLPLLIQLERGSRSNTLYLLQTPVRR